jgi:hypothetical protein
LLARIPSFIAADLALAFCIALACKAHAALASRRIAFLAGIKLGISALLWRLGQRDALALVIARAWSSCLCRAALAFAIAFLARINNVIAAFLRRRWRQCPDACSAPAWLVDACHKAVLEAVVRLRLNLLVGAEALIDDLADRLLLAFLIDAFVPLSAFRITRIAVDAYERQGLLWIGRAIVAIVAQAEKRDHPLRKGNDRGRTQRNEKHQEQDTCCVHTITLFHPAENAKYLNLVKNHLLKQVA